MRSHEQGNRTSRSLTKRVASLPDLSPKDEFAPKFFFILGIIFNLSLLAFFKYTDFLLENFNAFSKLAHLDFDIPLPHILLPLALSFVTFQQIAFLFDCYKRTKGELDENLHIDFIDYALFISFFPQLIAGPIVHHREMMPQFARLSNSSLTQSSREFEKSAFNRQQVLFQADFPTQPTNLTQDTKIANVSNKFASCNRNAKSNNSSLRGESMDSPKQSTINYEYLAKGIFIFSIGLFKKAFIADSFAKWANAGFSVVESGEFLNIAESWATSLSYTFQLYFDFSGYCDMAIGLALMFGIVLPLNFDSPYKSLNISEFWRRWHITLGRFLKECVYIPLGGNRVAKLLTLRNLFIVAFLSGIWHGAGWGFVIWGVLHGMAMVIHRIYSWWLEKNSSLGASCIDLPNFECSQTSSLVSHSKFGKNSTTSTANTRIVDSNKHNLHNLHTSSLRESQSDSWQSKTSDSNQVKDTMSQKRIDKSYKFTQSKKIANDSKVAKIDSLLHASRSAQNGKKLIFTQTRFYKFLCWFITFNFVNLAWIFFRAENLNGAVNLIKGMFGFVWVELPQEAYKANHLLKSIDGTDRTFLFIIVAFIVCLACRNSFEKLQNFSPTWTNAIFAVTLAIIALISLLANNYTPFLYFNF